MALEKHDLTSEFSFLEFYAKSEIDYHHLLPQKLPIPLNFGVVSKCTAVQQAQA